MPSETIASIMAMVYYWESSKEYRGTLKNKRKKRKSKMFTLKIIRNIM